MNKKNQNAIKLNWVVRVLQEQAVTWLFQFTETGQFYHHAKTTGAYFCLKFKKWRQKGSTMSGMRNEV